jgi:hypothetical protein
MNASSLGGAGGQRLGLCGLLIVASTLWLDGAYAAQHAPDKKNPKWRGDISRFQDHDWHVWRDGYWRHARHDGHLGWWWIVGPSWYFYPSPVYPYPNPWEPPTGSYVPPDNVVLPPAPPAEYWYYCEESKKYYPYVRACPGGWKKVLAEPAPANSQQAQ